METKSQKYTCPMHPQIMEDKPGNCPICEMNLVLAKETEGKDVDTKHHDGNVPRDIIMERSLMMSVNPNM